MGMEDQGRVPRLLGVLVTYRRPTELEAILTTVAAQDRPFDRLVVVDNDPSDAACRTVAARVPGAEYVPAPENLGPAGGIALGMSRLLEDADDTDWVATLDDDDPPDPSTYGALLEFATTIRGSDPSTGAVGVAGIRLDRRRGRYLRVPDHELVGAVVVDSIGGNKWPVYSVAAIRSVGVFRSDLFFGHEELEFGLRLGEAGFTLYADGPLWAELRRVEVEERTDIQPSLAVAPPGWRRYYSLRNLVRVLADHGAVVGAVYVSVVAGVGKPVVNLAVRPGVAWQNLRWNVRALRDAWSGRLGRTVEPGP